MNRKKKTKFVKIFIEQLLPFILLQIRKEIYTQRLLSVDENVYISKYLVILSSTQEY